MKERFETFTVLITKINRNIRRIKNQEMAEYGLRGPHVSCLYYLYTEGELTATELCERCESDKAAISRTLEHLEEQDFVVCEKKPAKRYKTPFFLTPKGKSVGREIEEKVNRVLDEISVGLTEEERVEFYRCLSIVSNQLQQCANRLNTQESI